MKTGKDVQVGDEVIVFPGWGQVGSQSTKRARVVKAARVWLELEEIGKGALIGRAWRMHRESQATKLHPEAWHEFFRTLEQQEERERAKRTGEILYRHGIEVRPGSRWHYQMTELADALEALAAELDKAEGETQA